MKPRHGFWVDLAIALTFVVAAVLGVVTYRNTSAIRQTEQATARAYEVREVIHAILSGLKDAETGQRGYLITGDDRYLERYYLGVNAAQDNLATLKRLTSDVPEERQRLDTLEKLVKQRQDALKEKIRLRRENPGESGFEQPRQLVLTHRGKQTMDEIRRLVAEMLGEEEDVLESYAVKSATRVTTTHSSIVAGHLLVLALLVLVVIAMHVDRRRRAEAEDQLLSSQEKLEAIVQSAMDAVISVDEDQRIVLLNPAAEELFQCEARQVLGESVDRFIPQRFREPHRQHLREFGRSSVARRRILDGGMISALRSDGKEIPIEASISQTIVDGRKLFTVILRDVSERETSRYRIREQSAMLDQVRDAIHLRDLNDRVLYWNRGSERLYGWKAHEVMGKNANDLLSPHHLDELDVARRTLMEKGAWSGEVRCVAKDGRELICEHRRTLIRDEAGRPNTQLIIDIDVTSRRRAEAQQRRSQRLESIGTLAGGIAHDLNNVLTPIVMGAKLLARDCPESSRRGLSETILASAERGADMIKQLLAFAGGAEGSREPVQLRGVIDEVKGILDHTFPKAVVVETDVAEDLWPISSDATEFSQLLMNLCVNARDAMPAGGRLTISAENVVLNGDRPPSSQDLKPGPHLLVTVADSGEGIPPEVIDNVFDPFFTTKEHGKGTGLGLSTCLGIVRGHGGTINVYSELGKGTRFAIYLPAERSEETTAAETRQSELPQGNGELVLLVDDEVLILEMARATLELHGYRVLTAGSGAEALACYQQHRAEIQVVVLDMMMPEMDGPTTMTALRAVDPAVRVISSSGLRRPETDSQTAEGQFQAFLPKPYSDEQVLVTLRKVLDEKQ